MSGRLRTILISPDAGLAADLGRALNAFGDRVWVQEIVPGYPSAGELSRILRTNTPDVVFLNFERPEFALLVIQALEADVARLPVVAFCADASAVLLRDAMRAGVRDFLAPPFSAGSMRRMLESLEALLSREERSFAHSRHIYSFLPAKPGSGATTVALNVAAAFSRRSGQRSLLVDLDLACGITRFLLKLDGNYSVVDAASRAHQLDEALWPQLVGSREQVDVLDSGPLNPQAHIAPADLQDMLEFARRRYGGICLDHSGNFERHSLEALAESRRIFLVTTPEVASLHLAQERMRVLFEARLAERVSLILNRGNQKFACEPHRAEELLGVPVAVSFTSDYRAAVRSVESGSWFPADSSLGREYAAFTARLMNTEEDAFDARSWLCALPGSHESGRPLSPVAGT